jgi:hypothetical protein
MHRDALGDRGRADTQVADKHQVFFVRRNNVFAACGG